MTARARSPSVRTLAVHPRFALVSPTGYGNLGDEAIIHSLTYAIRLRVPDAEVVGFTQNPGDTTVRHGIVAYTCSGISIPGYKITDVPPVRTSAAVPAMSPLIARARGAVARLPWLRRAGQLGRLAASEVRHRRLSAERIRDFDAVIVAGGGQLDDLWGGALGHPYTLARWGALARRAGARFLILSVGTGRLATPLSRLLVRRALALASYRSFRDERSRSLVALPSLTRCDPIVPDLAFALPPGLRGAMTIRGGKPVVALSPMAYADPRVWPIPDAARYRRHIQSFTDLGVRLVEAGHPVVLFATGGSDGRPVDELLAAARARLTPERRALLSAPSLGGVGDLMATLSSVDVVISARLHGIILAHVAGLPALAISHERKVRTLMEDMGHARYCHDIDDLDPRGAWQDLLDLLARRPELAAHIAATTAGWRRRIEQQYDDVFGTRALAPQPVGSAGGDLAD